MDNEKALPFMPEWAPPRKAFLTINEIFEIRNRDRAAEGLPPLDPNDQGQWEGLVTVLVREGLQICPQDGQLYVHGWVANELPI
jgi:hypothetical protein